MRLIFAALAASSLALWAQQPAALQSEVAVKVGNQPERIFTETDFSNLPRHRANLKEHGTSVAYEGVLLRDVLERAGAPLGKDLKGKALSTYILATARDGYTVVYTLTEMDAAFTDSEVLLADRAKGQPLNDTQGPFRIVVSSDKKPARSLRMLQRIDVVQLRK